MITVVILGIVAVIVVPNLINRQVENANRTKVKKAMAAYEKALNLMIIENDLKSTEAIRSFGQDDNCKSARGYFKAVQKGSTDCLFKTSDRVWWNITDLDNPIIILKDSQKDESTEDLQALAQDTNNKTIFALIGSFDNIGSLRVNDNGFEQAQENNNVNKNYMTKLWGFINNTLTAGSAGGIGTNEPEEQLTGFAKCNAEDATTCIITIDGVSTKYTKYHQANNIDVSKFNSGSNLDCLYDRETKTTDCDTGFTSSAAAGDYWISDVLGMVSEEEAKSDETCETSTLGFQGCKSGGDYYEASLRKCEKAGGHLTTIAEYKIAYNSGIVGNTWDWYFVQEEYSDNMAYEMRSRDGGPERHLKNSYYRSSHYVVCIGNE